VLNKIFKKGFPKMHGVQRFRLRPAKPQKLHPNYQQTFPFNSADHVAHQTPHDTIWFQKKKRTLSLHAQARPFSSLPK
jgi:hypothetical protein